MEVEIECIRRAIKKDLGYSFKKVYFRSYSVDDENIKEMRFYISYVMFNNELFRDKYIIWIDETAINNTSFK